MLTPWLLAIALATPPKVTLPPEHPKQAMRTSDDAQACVDRLLDDIARKSCADGRCRATGRLKAHIGATLHRWCRAGYQPQQIRRAAAAQREALVNPPPPGPPVPEETLIRLDDSKPWVRPAKPMVFAACDIVAKPLVMQGIPAMQRIARTHPDLAFVCVASERSAEQAAKALDGTDVPVLVDSNARWTRAAGIATYPTYLLVTADGFVTDTLVGNLDEDRIAQFVAAEALE